MMKKHLILLLVCYLFLSGTAHASIPAMGEQLLPVLLADFPDWQLIDDNVYSTGQGIGKPWANHFKATLMQWQDEALQVRGVHVLMNDLFADGVVKDGPVPWEITDYPPIPVTPEAKARLSTLSPRELFGGSFYNVGLYVDDLSGCADFLLNDGETLDFLQFYPETVVACVQDGAGHSALRVAEWDGAAYARVTSTAMMAGDVWFDDFHSSGDYLIFGVGYLETVAIPDENGGWRIYFLRCESEEDWFSYSFVSTGLWDSDVDPGNQSNAAHLYGELNFSTALAGLDLTTLLPDNGDITALLDPTGYACTKYEGVRMFDAPDGDFLAYCYQRLPGKVIAEQDKWVQVQIGSEAAGMKGWFYREDLAFGAEVNEVRCTFPSYELTDEIADEALEALFPGVMAHLNWEADWEPSPNSVDFWLVGTNSDGDFLVLVNQTAVATLPLSAFTSIGPTYAPWPDFLRDFP